MGWSDTKGNDDANLLVGSDSWYTEDFIYGYGGNDEIWGGHGQDRMYGGDDDDLILPGMPTNDVVDYWVMMRYGEERARIPSTSARR